MTDVREIRDGSLQTLGQILKDLGYKVGSHGPENGIDIFKGVTISIGSDNRVFIIGNDSTSGGSKHARQRKIHTGPKGGKYYIQDGRKVYL